LKQCSKTSPWTTDQAAEWWRQFRDSGPPPAAIDEITAPSEALTVAIDLTERTKSEVA
jgi:hypothetical protein